MTNPLLTESQLPRFSAIEPAHVEPAIRQLLEENRRELAALLARGGQRDLGADDRLGEGMPMEQAGHHDAAQQLRPGAAALLRHGEQRQDGSGEQRHPDQGAPAGKVTALVARRAETTTSRMVDHGARAENFSRSGPSTYSEASHRVGSPPLRVRLRTKLAPTAKSVPPRRLLRLAPLLSRISVPPSSATRPW